MRVRGHSLPGRGARGRAPASTAPQVSWAAGAFSSATRQASSAYSSASIPVAGPALQLAEVVQQERERRLVAVVHSVLVTAGQLHPRFVQPVAPLEDEPQRPGMDRASGDIRTARSAADASRASAWSSRSCRTPLPSRNSNNAIRASECAIRRGSAARSAERSDASAQREAPARSPATIRANASSCSACAHRAGSSGASRTACRNASLGEGPPALVVMDRGQAGRAAERGAGRPGTWRGQVRSARGCGRCFRPGNGSRRHAPSGRWVAPDRPAGVSRDAPPPPVPPRLPARPLMPPAWRRCRRSRRALRWAGPHRERGARHVPRCPQLLAPSRRCTSLRSSNVISA